MASPALGITQPSQKHVSPLTPLRIGTTIALEARVAYVRVKRRGNKSYYYLVESKREGKRVSQHIIRYLGTEPPTKEQLETLLREVKR